MEKKRDARLEERVYAAYFGRWRTVSDAYNSVYGKLSKKNTGRISLVTKSLIAKGWLTRVRQPGKRYAKITATMKPFYERFEGKGVRLTESDKNEIEHAIIGMTKETSLTPLYAMTDDEVNGTLPFRTPVQKLDETLASVLAYSLLILGNRAIDSASLSTALEEVRQHMKTAQVPPTYSDKGERIPIESDWTRAPIEADRRQAIFASGRRMAFSTKVHVRERLPIESSVAYKIASFLHGDFFASRVFKEIA